MATAKRATSKPKVGDFTGKQRETLIEENAAEVAEKAKQVSMATAAQAEEFAANIHEAKHPESVTIVDEVEDLGGVEKSDSAQVVVRVNEDIEDLSARRAGWSHDWQSRWSHEVGRKPALRT